MSSEPCRADEDCGPGRRCRLGACAPECRDDLDCPEGEVCGAEGRCAPPPQCSRASDCASGFTCADGRCQCLRDSACAAGEACLSGACGPMPECAQDAECAAYGRVCEPNQGVCLVPCSSPEECAPGADPQLALLLYRCEVGRCVRRCTGNLTCGGGLVCFDGACVRSNCATFADCPAGRYCTSAAGGVCAPYQPCAGAQECPANFECRPFDVCPPGFDCARPVCQELPRCLVDAECTPPPSYCQERHCQRAVACSGTAPCTGPGEICVGGACVPSPCRGNPDCAFPDACVDGQCTAPPPASAIVALRLLPASGVFEVGETRPLSLVGVRSNGSTVPVWAASYSVSPAGAADVTAGGAVTALAAGPFTVSATLAGSAAPAAQASLVAHAPASPGERVVRAIDAATRAPLQGVRVALCPDPPAAGPCPTPLEGLTDASGEVRFVTGAALVDVSAASPDLRPDGLPRYDRAAVAATAAVDVLLPLSPNPVHGAAGFTGAVSFAGTHGTGELALGLLVAARWDVVDQDLGDLFGEPFLVTLPVSGQQAPFFGATVAAADLGLPVVVPVKPTADALADPGPRSVVGFGGKVPLDALGSAGSPDLLSYVGALDYAVAPPQAFSARPYVPDTADVNGNGLCADPQRCPQGTEDVPDYAAFPKLSFAPSRQQLLRTELHLPALPPGVDSVVVAAVQARPDVGALVLGLTSRAGGAASTAVLRSGAPYGAAEAGRPGLWLFATSALPGGQRRTTARLLAADALPVSADLGPLLPLPAGMSRDAAARTLSPGQPAWDAVAAAVGGAGLGRAVLRSGQGRVMVYFEIAAGQAVVRVPDPPSGLAGDPASDPASVLELQAIELAGGVSAVEALDLRGVNLSELPALVSRYAR
ncbi:MAG TPA: hypothetical protein VFB81_16270, partial [Myxococcales bacterium]|nr:hypothetical protein [Myxococcales bacterium]